MATPSTASSPTDGPEPQDDPSAEAGRRRGSAERPGRDAPPVELPSHDPGRRAFFLEFGRQAVTAAGQVAGVADLVGRTSSGSVADLLGLGGRPTVEPGSGFVRAGRGAVVSPAAPAADDRFRSPYRVAGDEIILLDQRGIPESLEQVTARRGSDVAYYLRLGVIRGGPLAAQVAAYGLALTAAERAEGPADQRAAELRRTRQALVDARPSLRLVAWAMERMLDTGVGGDDGATDEATSEVSGADVAHALRARADAIATDIAAWQAAVTASLVETLAGLSADDAPLTLLLHGDHGPLHGGVVGAGLSALARLRDEGRPLRIFVTEGRPFMEGARLAAWELRQAGIEHRLIPDSAVAWLLGRERVDAALVNAEWVAANGDVGALVGSRTIAMLAAGTATRVIASGPAAVVDPSTPDGAGIPDESRPARDLAAYLAEVPVRTSDALVPATDVMPAATVDVLVTERGAAAPGAAS